eukprot:14244049-Ditylum_brightwellii.AAC.1
MKYISLDEENNVNDDIHTPDHRDGEDANKTRELQEENDNVNNHSIFNENDNDNDNTDTCLLYTSDAADELDGVDL